VDGRRHVVKVIGGDAEIEESRHGKKLLRSGRRKARVHNHLQQAYGQQQGRGLRRGEGRRPRRQRDRCRESRKALMGKKLATCQKML